MLTMITFSGFTYILNTNELICQLFHLTSLFTKTIKLLNKVL